MCPVRVRVDVLFRPTHITYDPHLLGPFQQNRLHRTVFIRPSDEVDLLYRPRPKRGLTAHLLQPTSSRNPPGPFPNPRPHLMSQPRSTIPRNLQSDSSVLN